MKTTCDDNCSTCTMQTQTHCTLLFAKSNNGLLKQIADALSDSEKTEVLIRPQIFDGEKETTTIQNPEQ